MPEPLIIGIDVRDLRVAKTGTRTYLEELCREFKQLESDELKFFFLDPRLPVYNGNQKLLKYIEHFRYQLWKQVSLPLKAKAAGCKVLFCSDNVVPLVHLGYQTIPVFHDAFFFENPEHYGKLWLRLYKKTALPAASRSAFVVTPTEYSKKQLIHYTGLPAEKLIVVPEGPKTLKESANHPCTDITTKLGLHKQEYLLHVGAMFKRKNIPALIQAFALMKKDGYADLKLVLAGSPPDKGLSNDYNKIMQAIAETNLSKEVIFTGYLPDADLAEIYKNALMYVFPSVNEGFGIPVLEAFRYNLPVLVADNTCLLEVGGDAVLTFNPFDVNDLCSKIKQVLNDEQLREDLKQKGQQRLKDFSWRKTALMLIDLFKNAASR